MSVSTAALILLWLIVIVLVFAMAGLRQQLRQIQYGNPSRAAGPAPVDVPRSRVREGKVAQALLLVSEGCPVCHEVSPLFVTAATSAPDIDFVVLTRGDGGAPETLGAARHSVDPGLFNGVDPGWQPALVHAGPAGEVLAVRPVGSPQAMKSELSKLMDAYSQA